ncbi:hypothetical protein Dsin_022801 [Dipteronia sinensis]|uniref:Endonuclease/exonuclease/phosphatase domain-containing protein n=1 Tax=Dipteronia sinensis TaxID=43782 RepID=A0AAE0A3P6_9ROSI|nr:hypothetical protein Dsin_022801 [Dipteronia sinensis]
MRGAGKQLFARNISDIRRLHNFEILAICEPRISGLRAKKVIKRLLWSYLDAIKGCFHMLWLIAREFNEITSCEEKRGGRPTYSNSGFSNWIYRNDLVDMGFIGPRFTWMNKRGIGEEIWERLDRALYSMEWRLHYSEGFVSDLPRLFADHCPMLI